MKNAIASIEDYESVLESKERELIVQRDKVWRFLNKDHTSLEVKKYQTQVRKADFELSKTLLELMDDKDIASEFRTERKALCERFRALSIYTKSMDDALCHDLLEKRLIEDGEKIDLLKNLTFLLAAPVSFMTAMKDGLFGGHGNLFEAAGAGLGFGAMIVARKRVANAFRSVGRSVCDAPHRIKNSYFLFYTWQTVREQASVAEAVLKDPAGFVTAVVRRGTFQKPQF